MNWENWQAFAQSDLGSVEYHKLSEQLQWFDSFDIREFTPAAVMVLIEDLDNPQVILTVRSTKLSHHGGQVSFAGGKKDPEDIDVVMTALRETEEELGVALQHITVLGQMPPLPTISAYQVHPVIGILEKGAIMQVNEGEVDEVFRVPLWAMMRPENYQPYVVERRNTSFQSIQFPHAKHIWGVTATILLGLANAYQHWLQVQNACFNQKSH